MLIFILRRVLSGLVLIVVITVIAFTLLYHRQRQHRPHHRRPERHPRGRGEKAAELGLDRPLFVQFGDWLDLRVHR